MRSILLSTFLEEGFESRLQAALDLARAHDGHIAFVHAAPVGEYIAVDPFGGGIMAAAESRAAQDAAKEQHARIKKAMAGEDVPWNFFNVDGAPDDAVIAYSRLSDILVLSEPPLFEEDESDLASSLTYFAVEAHCPVLAVPHGSKRLDCTGKAVVAWNGSVPAANALRAAVPMLRQSEEVVLLTIGEDPAHFPAEAAASYLSHHEIKSEIITRPRVADVSDMMHDLILDLKADYLVMGAFGHGRMREFLFGGVSRHFVRRAPVPVLLTQ